MTAPGSETLSDIKTAFTEEKKMSSISGEMETLLATGSALRIMFEEGKKMAAEFGAENIYDFSLGNPSVPAPLEFNEALKAAVDENDSFALHSYMSNAGYEDTRQAIADDLNRRFKTSYKWSNVTMTVGAANAIVIFFKTIIDPGDEVAVFAPFFLEYRNYIANFGGVTKIVPPNPPTFMPDPAALKETLTEKTKAVIINNPNNPTGAVYDEETIKSVSTVLREAEERYGHAIYLIADEPYRELVFDGTEVPFLPRFYSDTVIAYSFSKSLSIPGERVGYLLIPDEVSESEKLNAAASIGIRVLGCVNAPSLQQKAIIKALGARTDITVYDANRKLLLSALRDAGFEYVEPKGAFYVFVKTPEEDDRAFAALAKDKFHVLTSAGSAFYCPGYVRMAYCVSADMIKRAIPAITALGHEYGLN